MDNFLKLEQRFTLSKKKLKLYFFLKIFSNLFEIKKNFNMSHQNNLLFY